MCRNLGTLGLVALLLACLTPAVASGTDGNIQAASAGIDSNRELRVRYWDLWQSSGAELYGEMCSSCHDSAAGRGEPATGVRAPSAPALAHLERAGIPREHWTYVLASACEDTHHRAKDGHAAMPCWQRIFREAMGNEAAPMLVNQRLVAYLASIQK